MKELLEVTREIMKAVEHCPNCGGVLAQKRNYKIRCQDCGYEIHVQTRNERLLAWLISTVPFVLLAGLFLGQYVL